MLIGPFEGTAIVVTGDDRRSYLDDVSTQRLDDLEAGDARPAMVLDVHGAPLAVFVLAAGDDQDWLLAPKGADEHVLDVLARRTFLADVRFEATDNRVLSLRGDDVGQALTVVLDESVDVGGWVSSDGVSFARHTFGVEMWGPAAAIEAVTDALRQAGGQVVDAQQLDDVRVRLGEPRFGHEISAPHLPEELGLLPTHVHLAKGCYPGQEAVARMWMLGRPRRQLARIDVVGSFDVGDEVGSGRQRVQVTGLTASGSEGLAFVPADAEIGSTYSDGDRSVEVVELVGDGLAQPGHDPAMTRRRDRREASAR